MTYGWSGGSSRRWRRVRADQLKHHPTCQVVGCHAMATEVHHVHALEDGGDRFDQRNLRSLCHDHHAQRHGARPKPDVDPATGLPRSGHWWCDE